MKSYQRQLPHLTDPDEMPAIAIPEHEPASGLSMLQIFTITRHYWKESLGIAIALVMLCAVFIKMMPKSYTATATLIVNSTRESPLPNQQLGGNDLADYVATQAELISSPGVLLPVVEKLGLMQDSSFSDGLSGTPAEVRDFAERNLATSVLVDEGRGGQLLQVHVSTGNPAKSAQIANAIADEYLRQDRQRTNDPVNQQAQLSSQELEQLRQKVTDAQTRVTAFRNQYGLTDLNAGVVDGDTQNLAQLQARLLQAQNERRTLEAQQAGQIDSGDEALASARVTGLRSELAGLQEKLADLRPTLGPRHPEIMGLQAQIRAAQASLRAALGNLSSNIDTQLKRTRQLENELTQAVNAQQAKVMQLRQTQDQGSKLTLELQSAQAVYKAALDGYDQVKFNTHQDFANVSLVSYATPPVRPSKPKKMQLFLMACIVSAGLGVLIPLLYELGIDRRVRCKDDLERGLGIRVLAQLQTLPSSGAL